MFAKFRYKTLKITPKLHVARDAKIKNPSATVLFLHGLAADSGTWDGVFEDMKKRKKFDNMRVVAIDLLGFGGSPEADYFDYRLSGHMTALKKAIKRLNIKQPLYIVGHSMGCILAVEYARTHDVAGLLLAAPPFLLPDEQKAFLDNAYTEVFTKFEKNTGTKGQDNLGKVVEKATNFNNNYAKSKAFSESMKHVVLCGNAWASAKKLTIPIRIIRGKFDSLTIRANDVSLAKNENIKFVEVISGHDVKTGMRTGVVKQLEALVK